MKKIITSIFSLLFAGGLSAQSIKSIPAKEFQTAMQGAGNYVLIDVRTAPELANGKLDGALHMDIRGVDFNQKIQELDRNTPVFVYCHSGGRSMMAAKRMASLGFTQIFNLQGGITSWTRQGMPVKK
ncbi:MAG: rhodanese-like domain-containing protein [Bacteroidia bacterium]|nr:rhodanese-like domain-containing protein [Bacteroidia bacterium]